MSRTYDEVRRHEGGMGLQEKPMYRRKLEVEGAFLALLLEPKILILEEFDFLDQSSYDLEFFQIIGITYSFKAVLMFFRKPSSYNTS